MDTPRGYISCALVCREFAQWLHEQQDEFIEKFTWKEYKYSNGMYIRTARLPCGIKHGMKIVYNPADDIIESSIQYRWGVRHGLALMQQGWRSLEYDRGRIIEDVYYDYDNDEVCRIHLGCTTIPTRLHNIGDNGCYEFSCYRNRSLTETKGTLTGCKIKKYLNGRLRSSVYYSHKSSTWTMKRVGGVWKSKYRVTKNKYTLLYCRRVMPLSLLRSEPDRLFRHSKNINNES